MFMGKQIKVHNMCSLQSLKKLPQNFTESIYHSEFFTFHERSTLSQQIYIYILLIAHGW